MSQNGGKKQNWSQAPACIFNFYRGCTLNNSRLCCLGMGKVIRHHLCCELRISLRSYFATEVYGDFNALQCCCFSSDPLLPGVSYNTT